MLSAWTEMKLGLSWDAAEFKLELKLSLVCKLFSLPSVLVRFLSPTILFHHQKQWTQSSDSDLNPNSRLFAGFGFRLQPAHYHSLAEVKGFQTVYDMPIYECLQYRHVIYRWKALHLTFPTTLFVLQAICHKGAPRWIKFVWSNIEFDW